MRILRVEHRGTPYYGELVDDATVRLWTAAPWSGGEATDRLVPVAKARPLPPVEPSKILCMGRNYAAHAQELGNAVPKTPLLFLKAPSTLCAHGEVIVKPPQTQRLEHEGEIGVVIGHRLKNASADEVRAGIYGITCVNDVTARDVQRSDGQFTRGKSYDTFCPTGPWIETEWQEHPLSVTTRVNGEVRQHAPATSMVFPIIELIGFMAQQMTLLPGDLIPTGTPEGVGPLVAGDQVEVEVSGVGVLSNPVQDA